MFHPRVEKGNHVCVIALWLEREQVRGQRVDTGSDEGRTVPVCVRENVSVCVRECVCVCVCVCE